MIRPMGEFICEPSNAWFPLSFSRHHVELDAAGPGPKLRRSLIQGDGRCCRLDGSSVNFIANRVRNRHSVFLVRRKGGHPTSPITGIFERCDSTREATSIMNRGTAVAMGAVSLSSLWGRPEFS